MLGPFLLRTRYIALLNGDNYHYISKWCPQHTSRKRMLRLRAGIVCKGFHANSQCFRLHPFWCGIHRHAIGLPLLRRWWIIHTLNRKLEHNRSSVIRNRFVQWKRNGRFNMVDVLLFNWGCSLSIRWHSLCKISRSPKRQVCVFYITLGVFRVTWCI